MTVTPSGLPAWTRTADHTQYGGDVNKRNYGQVGLIDATTDVGAEEICRLASDLAACARTSPFAVITYSNQEAVPAAPTVESVLMMTGVRSTSYVGSSAPSGFPSAARVSACYVTFTFSASYNDDYSVAGTFTPTGAQATAHSDSTAYIAQPSISGSTVSVRVFDAAGNPPAADVRVTLVVW